MSHANMARPLPEEVHLWTVDVTQAAIAPALQRSLDADELSRAARLRRDADRYRFITAHGALRDILARYLGTFPSDVRFERLFGAKPRLAEGTGALDFNIAYADRIMVCAITAGSRVGVDVEDVDGGNLQEEASYLSSSERAAVAALPPDRQSAALTACWTRKEALAKAVGDGLRLEFPAFDVTVTPGDARILSLPPSLVGTEWRLAGFEQASGCLGAVAVEGSAVLLRQLQWRAPNR